MANAGGLNHDPGIAGGLNHDPGMPDPYKILQTFSRSSEILG